MKVVSADEMRRIDLSCGVPSMTLMENAAAGGVKAALDMITAIDSASVLVLAGKGNNGGDGFAMARLLKDRAVRVKVIAIRGFDKMRGDAARQYQLAKEAGVHMSGPDKLGDAIAACDLLVDAMLGTGLTPRALPDDISQAISSIALEAARRKSFKVLAVDVPSGICSDTGRIFDRAVAADRTISFGRPKRGLFLYPAAANVGELSLDSIGIADAMFDSVPGSISETREVAALLPHRSPTAHKGAARVLVVGGSKGMSGAVLLAAKAALKSGAGYAYAAMPDGNSDTGAVIEAVRLAMPSGGPGRVGQFAPETLDAIRAMSVRVHATAIGGGFGVGEIEKGILKELAGSWAVPSVFDADALLQTSPDDFARAKAPRVLTPHAGEFAALFGGSARENESDRVGQAVLAARRANQVVLYKGRPTVIASPDGSYFINSTGSELLATCGSGDVLSGIIAALLSQGLIPINAAVAGAFLHGRAADLWEFPVGLTANDIADSIPKVWASVERAVSSANHGLTS